MKNMKLKFGVLLLGGVISAKRYFDSETYKSRRIITRKEVSDHYNKETGIWTTYKEGVYDITNFVDVHPGGTEKIMMSAGSAIDPYWAMYSFHKKEEIESILRKHRIGTLPENEVKINIPDYEMMKIEHVFYSPKLTQLLKFPFVAECPADLLINDFYTKPENFFVRNHNKVPVIDVNEYRLNILDKNTSEDDPIELSLTDLKTKFEKTTVETIIACTGNRRYDMNNYKETKGVLWKVGAIGNGKWEGVKVIDILKSRGIDKNNCKGLHLIIKGHDRDFQLTNYAISIPLEDFYDGNNAILAFSYNGADIPVEHGYPIRFVFPGYQGVRNVKWVKSIEISETECQGPYQQKDYKIIPKDLDWEKADLSKLKPVMKYVVNSVIVNPSENAKIKKGEEFTVKGWAIGTYGSPIKTVEVSLDHGKHWKEVKDLQFNLNQEKKNYGWTLWQCNINSNDFKGNEIWVRAFDQDGNSQPVDCHNIWNIRGLLNNSIHKVKVNFI